MSRFRGRRRSTQSTGVRSLHASMSFSPSSRHGSRMSSFERIPSEEGDVVPALPTPALLLSRKPSVRNDSGVFRGLLNGQDASASYTPRGQVSHGPLPSRSPSQHSATASRPFGFGDGSDSVGSASRSPAVAGRATGSLGQMPFAVSQSYPQPAVNHTHGDSVPSHGHQDQSLGAHAAAYGHRLNPIRPHQPAVETTSRLDDNGVYQVHGTGTGMRRNSSGFGGAHNSLGRMHNHDGQEYISMSQLGSTGSQHRLHRGRSHGSQRMLMRHHGSMHDEEDEDEEDAVQFRKSADGTWRFEIDTDELRDNEIQTTTDHRRRRSLLARASFRQLGSRRSSRVLAVDAFGSTVLNSPTATTGEAAPSRRLSSSGMGLSAGASRSVRNLNADFQRSTAQPNEQHTVTSQHPAPRLSVHNAATGSTGGRLVAEQGGVIDGEMIGGHRGTESGSSETTEQDSDGAMPPPTTAPKSHRVQPESVPPHRKGRRDSTAALIGEAEALLVAPGGGRGGSTGMTRQGNVSNSSDVVAAMFAAEAAAEEAARQQRGMDGGRDIATASASYESGHSLSSQSTGICLVNRSRAKVQSTSIKHELAPTQQRAGPGGGHVQLAASVSSSQPGASRGREDVRSSRQQSGLSIDTSVSAHPATSRSADDAMGGAVGVDTTLMASPESDDARSHQSSFRSHGTSQSESFTPVVFIRSVSDIDRLWRDQAGNGPTDDGSESGRPGSGHSTGSTGSRMHPRHTSAGDQTAPPPRASTIVEESQESAESTASPAPSDVV